MRGCGQCRHHGVVSLPSLSASRPVPRRPVLYRRPDHRLLGGVSGGIADHLGVPAMAIRLVFLVLCAAGGLGVVLYAAYWIVVPAPPVAAGAPTRTRRAWLEYAGAAILAVAAVLIARQGTALGQLFVPSILACLGGALIWRQASDTQRQRWWELSRTSLAARPQGRIGRIRLAAGAALVVLGAIAVLAGTDISAIRDGLIAVAVTIVGIALITGPWWVGLVAELGAERRARIRAQDREELAARVHDSVLQTLALIQRNAAQPREVARLARGQERELRALLYGTPATPAQLSEALRTAAAEVEDAYAIAIEVVVVGDALLDERLAALVAAAREALVNAAKHSGVQTVSLYAEVEAEQCVAFVKDRGSGFDPSEVADDRQGVRSSIIGRVERHGGQVSVRSSPGQGTEIEIRMGQL
jgi:signal transduction histidine kinase/phage shock protein PspC (stress-responsive transcriptional regulator)